MDELVIVGSRYSKDLKDRLLPIYEKGEPMSAEAAKMDLPKNFAFPCSVGKVQRTISNHPYMRLHIDKWKENGASIREIILMEFLRRSI